MNIIKEFWSIIVAFMGIAVSWGVMKQKLKHQDKQIEELERKQDNTEKLLQEINTSLTELNVKVGFLVNGQLKIEKEE